LPEAHPESWQVRLVAQVFGEVQSVPPTQHSAPTYHVLSQHLPAGVVALHPAPHLVYAVGGPGKQVVVEQNPPLQSKWLHSASVVHPFLHVYSPEHL
jgi:hypothetical protein